MTGALTRSHTPRSCGGRGGVSVAERQSHRFSPAWSYRTPISGALNMSRVLKEVSKTGLRSSFWQQWTKKADTAVIVASITHGAPGSSYANEGSEHDTGPARAMLKRGKNTRLRRHDAMECAEANDAGEIGSDDAG